MRVRADAPRRGRFRRRSDPSRHSHHGTGRAPSVAASLDAHSAGGEMKRLVMTMALSALALPAASAFAQTKTITGEARVVTATVEAIEKGRREITVKKPDGKYDVLYVPAD